MSAYFLPTLKNHVTDFQQLTFVWLAVKGICGTGGSSPCSSEGWRSAYSVCMQKWI